LTGHTLPGRARRAGALHGKPTGNGATPRHPPTVIQGALQRWKPTVQGALPFTDRHKRISRQDARVHPAKGARIPLGTPRIGASVPLARVQGCESGAPGTP